MINLFGEKVVKYRLQIDEACTKRAHRHWMPFLKVIPGRGYGIKIHFLFFANLIPLF